MAGVKVGEGPPSARIMIVGEVFSESDSKKGTPFSGTSGEELNRMLHEAGIMRSECYLSNVVNAYPQWGKVESLIPEQKRSMNPSLVRVRDKYVAPLLLDGFESLKREIALVRPRVIIALGNAALWALTGADSVAKWRGSLLETDGEVGLPGIRVIPTFHPSTLYRMWEWRAIAVQDLKRAAREAISPVPPKSRQYLLKPSFSAVMERLDWFLGQLSAGPFWIDLDLETKAGHIACCGLSWSRSEAICIPLMCEDDKEGYWLLEEEAKIVYKIYLILTHPNARVRGQNLLYDCQYTYRHWRFVPNVAQDTMISHHTLWAGMKNNLAFQASMYCDWYCNWKPDKETWKEGG